MNFLCFNGKMIPSGQPILQAQNRGFRYGDGVFETMKVHRGKVLLQQLHFDRLQRGLQILSIAGQQIIEQHIFDTIIELCRMNHCLENARVRMAVYRDENHRASFVMEATKLREEANQLNEQGWVVGIHPTVRKSKDVLANIKSANYLPYILADLYAQKKKWDECLVLNTDNDIADASKANVFAVIGEDIYTPSLDQGCVAGVMRRYIIEQLKKLGRVAYQKKMDEALLLQADEVFLTNAINGIRWVSAYKEKQYSNTLTKDIYEQVMLPMYQ